MKIYNTLSRTKEEITPISGDVIRIYSCGLTVYDYAHIGNLRKYIFDDVLKRTLEYFDYKVKHIQNVTDVGHLTSDEDEGEDKIEKSATREGKTAFEIAKFYEKAFVEDLKKLNIELPDEMPKATENIQEQIELVKKLEEKGFTYKTSDGIYFNTSKLKDYGKLARLDIENLKEGSRVEKNLEKKNPTDFALWKLSPDGERMGTVPSPGTVPEAPSGSKQFTSSGARRQMEWPSPWGVGFPGWHLECSAMATKFLGQPFEIHTGGVDHIAVHHTNEIAQSEAACDKPLAKYWVHSEHLLEDGRKMAKSDGHFIRLQDLEEKGYSPLDYRYLCLTASYRSKLDFSWKSFDAARSARRKINDAYNLVCHPESPPRHPELVEGSVANATSNPSVIPSDAQGTVPMGSVPEAESRDLSSFNKALADDLDTPRALAFIFKNLSRLSSAEFEKIDEIFAILEKIETKKEDGIIIEGYAPREVIKLALERQKAREQKNFKKSDELRDKISKLGFNIEDTQDGPKISSMSSRP
ncbi:MAG: cysteine--tRNA ligase [bacterium]